MSHFVTSVSPRPDIGCVPSCSHAFSGFARISQSREQNSADQYFATSFTKCLRQHEHRKRRYSPSAQRCVAPGRQHIWAARRASSIDGSGNSVCCSALLKINMIFHANSPVVRMPMGNNVSMIFISSSLLFPSKAILNTAVDRVGHTIHNHNEWGFSRDQLSVFRDFSRSTRTE